MDLTWLSYFLERLKLPDIQVLGFGGFVLCCGFCCVGFF